MNRYQPYYQTGPFPYSQNMGPTPYGQPPMQPYQNNYMNQMGAFTGMAGMGGMMGMGQITQNNAMSQAGGGLSKLSSAFRGFNYSSFLDGTQKTLTTINQIIPLVYQVTPMIKNASTMFRVANEVKRMASEPVAQSVVEPVIIEQEVETPVSRSAEQPTYF